MGPSTRTKFMLLLPDDITQMMPSNVGRAMPLEGIPRHFFPLQGSPDLEDSVDEQVSEVSSIESPTRADDPDYLSVGSISDDQPLSDDEFDTGVSSTRKRRRRGSNRQTHTPTRPASEDQRTKWQVGRMSASSSASMLGG